MKRKALLGLISASMLIIIGGGIAHAAFDENLNMYTLDTVVVEADKTNLVIPLRNSPIIELAAM